jgi:hypothetical protein
VAPPGQTRTLGSEPEETMKEGVGFLLPPLGSLIRPPEPASLLTDADYDGHEDLR